MGVTSKEYVFSVVMCSALYISVGLTFNFFTVAAIPSCISQRMQHTIVEITEEIKVPKWKMPALVSMILFDLLIILWSMIPKMTFDQCKETFEGMKRWHDVGFLASFTVSFQNFLKYSKM